MEANLAGATLLKTDLRGATLDRVDLKSVTLEKTKLDLSQAGYFARCYGAELG